MGKGDKKKRRPSGRPARYVMPPKIDASAETIADVVLRSSPVEGFDRQLNITYRCAECDCEVAYPDTLYQDGRCKDCTAQVDVK